MLSVAATGLPFGWDPRRFLRPAASSALIAVALSALSGALWAQVSPQTLKERREMLEGTLTKDPLEIVAKLRYACATGQQPRLVARHRTEFGSVILPDAADACLIALLRSAREGQLFAHYERLLTEANGRSDGHERLPGAIGATVMKGGASQVPIGGQRAAVVTAALALDAGFTVAYQKGEPATPRMPDLPTLRSVAERCLAQQEADLSLCYSTGYMYGVRAFNRMSVAAPQ